MAVKLFKLPDPGEGLVEADIVTWKVKVGDQVKTNDIVVEIETAKSLVELPIPWEGTVVELLVSEGDTVDVGAPIVSIDVVGSDRDDEHASAPGAGGDSVPTGPGSSDEAGGERVANLVGYGPSAGSTSRRARKAAARADGQEQPRQAPAPEPEPVAEPDVSPVGLHADRPLAKPPVRKLAKDLGIDLRQVTPSGPDGIITRADVEGFTAGAGASEGDASAARPAPVVRPGERETRIPIKGCAR